ncbi:hypothetical protein M569_11559, partial [Genlisea aurea]
GFPAKNVAVIGAGVSGLSAAYKLKLNGLNVTVFEADGRAGGKIRTSSQDSLIWDEGANTMTESEEEVGFLLDNLGLREKQQFPLSQQKRYVVKNGKPALLPSNPFALIASNILSSSSKLQIFLEPFLWKQRNSEETQAEESVGGFFQRHFGKEVVDYLVDPFVAGTSGGDPESLSMRHAFPDLWNLEKRFGSVMSGAVLSKLSAGRGASEKNKGSSTNERRKRKSFSFIGGMQTLTDALSNEIGENELKLRSKVLGLSSNNVKSSKVDSWSISYASSDGKSVSLDTGFDAVIMTAPLSDVKQMK